MSGDSNARAAGRVVVDRPVVRSLIEMISVGLFILTVGTGQPCRTDGRVPVRMDWIDNNKRE